MISLTHEAHIDMLFRLPYGNGTLTFGEIKKHYIEFASSMDGGDETSCLSFYYERNPVTSVFEFRDSDAEADIADAMSIDYATCSEGESLVESTERKKLAESSGELFKLH